MAKASKRIRREIVIGGVKRWITGATEQEYAENLMKALNLSGAVQFQPQKHSFQTYAQRWFEVFSKPNVSLITAITYERQLKLHIYPAFDGMDVEDIKPTDVQEMFNRMGDVTKETKMKARMVLNMVLEQAVDDGLIQKNPLAARSVRIVGGSSHAIEPYSVAQMRFLVQRLDLIVKPSDRAFLALHALHPLRPEEVLGLLWRDLDFSAQTIHIERAVTHPSRNAPLVKETKTQASRRTINLVPQIIPLLERGAEDEFVLGGEKPLSYSMVRKMCERIQRQTGFEERITPRRFRTTVLTDLYDATKDIKQAQRAAGHTTAAMTLKHYVKGREETANTATPIAQVYGL